MLKIFNTLTKKKEIFNPINTNEIKLYVCGITAYDLCHLGHARTFIIFDTVVRYLKYRGYKVKYVRNITDIDDKIIQKSCKNNETINYLTNYMIKEMYLDLDILNILRPNYEPKVSDYIDVIINIIQLLIKKKHAYVTSSGDVMFAVNTVCKYGILSNRNHLKINIKNNRYRKNINIEILKNNPSDFALWKSSKLGEPYWISPWGNGRPGWHIECSALSYVLLGEKIDIHGGGSDLIFPHHENELAQSTCAYNIIPQDYVNIWMHTGLLSLNYEKMSKSLNNSYTIREILKKYDPETIRFFLLSSHYRNQLQYNESNLKKAHIALNRLYISLRNIDPIVQSNEGKNFISRFVSTMNNDFNIPEAYSILFEMAHELNNLKKTDYIRAQGLASNLKKLANILGILYQNPEDHLTSRTMRHRKIVFDQKIIMKLIQIRENARNNRQWELADRIRNQLIKMGILLEDEYIGKTTWRYYD